MTTYDLLGAWFRVADWIAYDLGKDGREAAVLKPLAQHSKSALTITRAACSSTNYMHRKVGGDLAGWIAAPPPDLLKLLFDAESKRDQALPPDSIARLDIQSAVENLVFAATRWMRREPLRPAAAAALMQVVEDVLNGRYWNTCSYAMTTLCRYRVAGCDDLLQRFDRFAKTAKVIHPSGPSFTQEKTFATALLAKNPQTLMVIENLIDRSNAIDLSSLDDSSRAVVNELLAVASAYDASRRERD